jgi:hypothetical protein
MFDSWRREHPRGSRLPAELYQAAIALLDRYPIGLVSLEPRLNQQRPRRRAHQEVGSQATRAKPTMANWQTFPICLDTPH